MKKKIILPSYLTVSVNPLKRGFPKYYKVFVADVETANGKPYLLTLYNGEKIELIEVKPETIEIEFVKYLKENCKTKGCTYLLFFHNMQFDITAILNQNEHMFEYLNPPIFVTHDQEGNKLGETKVYAQKVWYGRVIVNKGVRVKLLDSTNFIIGSLYNISRKLNLDHKKPERPKGVEKGKEVQSLKHPEFKHYVTQEILAEYDLANYIVDMHRKYNVNFCVSSSQFASKVFKKHFLKEPITQTPPYVRKLAELSLHGGRADYFERGIRVIPDVKLYDYNSFYSYALYHLPPLTKGKWENVKEFVDDYEGFYIVSAYVNKCKYPLVLKDSASFEYANGEKIENVVITSYELREALRSKEIEVNKVNGWIWIPDKDAVNPFKGYVKEFYDLKRLTSKDNPLYIVYKLLLNQLYGKTYQTVRLTDYDETPDYEIVNGKPRKCEIEWRAGGLYLPHVGSWITSLCRAKLHRDLHKYNAIACATDSFITTEEAETGDELGGLKLECEGLLLSIRPKMYVIFSRHLQEDIKKVGDLKKYLKMNLNNLNIDVDIVKYATHGFRGDVKDLLRLYVESENKYMIQHMNKIRESLRQNKQPRVMESQKRVLKVNWEDERGFCGMKKGQAIISYDMCNDNCFTCAHNQRTW